MEGARDRRVAQDISDLMEVILLQLCVRTVRVG